MMQASGTVKPPVPSALRVKKRLLAGEASLAIMLVGQSRQGAGVKPYVMLFVP